MANKNEVFFCLGSLSCPGDSLYAMYGRSFGSPDHV